MRGSLHHALDFRRVQKRGRRAGCEGLVVIAAERPGGGRSRLGLAVKVKGGSVIRNRSRRRLRAAFSAASPVDGFDVIVRADEKAAAMEFQEIVGALSGGLEATGVARGGPR